mmetsp:Transcript_120354/g.268982  ORF Transcript_120354/g.268982 Transcript_120354/m.268982 type:complete len:672 (-) Transcript_120354:48-2063(-)
MGATGSSSSDPIPRGARLVRDIEGSAEGGYAAQDVGGSSKACFASIHAERRCTDPGCLTAFLVFFCGMGYIYASARSQGNLAKLTHGFDWRGTICGVDEGVRHRPFLFWCAPGGGDVEDLSLMDGICVPKCPGGNATESWCPGQARPFEYGTPEEADTKQVVIGMVRNLTRRPDYTSTEALGYCFPTKDLVLLNKIVARTHVTSLTKQFFLAGHGALESWRFLLGVAGACIVLGYAFLFVLWSCFEKLLYVLVTGTHLLLLLAAGGLAYVGYFDEHNFFATYFSENTARLCAWTCCAVVSLVWVLFCILCCYSKGAMSVTVDSVQATCEVIAKLPTMLLQPLVHSLVVISTLLALLYGFAWVLSTGKVHPQGEPLRQGGIEIQGMHRSFEFTGYQWACLAYWVFGTVWILEVVNALGQFAISHAVVIFACFDTREFLPMLHGYWAGLVYHLGTLAFGGFVIGCLKILAAVCAFLARQTRDEHGLPTMVTRVVCCCCAYCFLCVERLLTMVNDLVYTDVALQGSGYIEAAENVVRIAANNPATYAAIKGSATAVRVLGVTTIGGFGTFLSYRALSSSALHMELDGVFAGASSMLQTSNILGTTIASGFVCFYVAMAFMMVFYQTTYTLMYCMLIGAVKMGDEDPSASAQKQTLLSDKLRGAPGCMREPLEGD